MKLVGNVFPSVFTENLVFSFWNYCEHKRLAVDKWKPYCVLR